MFFFFSVFEVLLHFFQSITLKKKFCLYVTLSITPVSYLFGHAAFALSQQISFCYLLIKY